MRVATRQARRWRVAEVDAARVAALAGELGIPRRLADLLTRRGVEDPAEAAAFLAPARTQLHDPFLLPDMREACDAVHAAVARGETITLYGDYDVDGTTAVAILYWVVKKLGGAARIQIPDRFDDGYGLSEKGLEAVRAAGSRMIITADQGVVAHAEIARANELGIEVIVTDHHTPGATLPPARAVVHPALPGSRYPNPHLCGAAVSFKLGEALLRSAPDAGVAETADGFVDACLDLVALATVADMTPLRGENRVIVALGLERMRRTRHPGLRALLRASGRKVDTVTVDDLGFGVAPLLNAAGRLQGPQLALDCLMARGRSRAEALAKDLIALNRTRRELTEDLVEEARERFLADPEAPLGVVEVDSDAVGIVGLVAGRLKEAYWKPFIVCARRGDDLVGSCRSVDGFNIRDCLEAAGEHLDKFGGHAQAAGLTLRSDRFPAFRDAVMDHAAGALRPEHLTPRLEVDQVLALDELTFELLEEIEPLGPCGVGNPAPLFVLEGCEVDRVKVMGRSGAHVRLHGKGFPRHLDPVGFHLRSAVDEELEGGGPVDLAFKVGADEWQGRRRIQMRLEDLRAAGS